LLITTHFYASTEASYEFTVCHGIVIRFSRDSAD